MPELRDELQSALGDAYRVERELGGGGMSRVFVAEERALGRRVVVKVLRPELAVGVSLERFHREIQLAARLQHPLIVPVLAAGEAAGLPFYTMPFIDGETRRARLAREGALALPAALHILRDVARALAYAHEQGIVHRDRVPRSRSSGSCGPPRTTRSVTSYARSRKRVRGAGASPTITSRGSTRWEHSARWVGRPSSATCCSGSRRAGSGSASLPPSIVWRTRR